MVVNRYLSDRRRWSVRAILLTRDGATPETVGPPDQRGVDDRAALNGSLRMLPSRQRAAIVLRYYLDLPDTDIAAELGCTRGAVRSYISRGLAALRITIDEDES